MVIHLVQEELGAVDLRRASGLQTSWNYNLSIFELIVLSYVKETAWGETHVRICRTLPCALQGSYSTCKKFEEKLGVKEGHVSEDGKFSIELWNVLLIVGKDQS